jgi:hypothetical protein
MASSYVHDSVDDGRLRRRGGGVCWFGLLWRFCRQIPTLIRHAAASSAILAVAVGMHLPPAFARLVSAAGLPLPATPHFQCAVVITVHLATVASAADKNLLTTTIAKK